MTFVVISTLPPDLNLYVNFPELSAYSPDRLPPPQEATIRTASANARTYSDDWSCAPHVLLFRMKESLPTAAFSNDVLQRIHQPSGEAGKAHRILRDLPH